LRRSWRLWARFWCLSLLRHIRSWPWRCSNM
jgi:hypothetical protein